MLGAFMVIATSVVRLANGNTRLRPFAAMKRMPLYFVVYLAMWWVLQLLFPKDERSLHSALMSAAAVSLTLSFYFSAYRKQE